MTQRETLGEGRVVDSALRQVRLDGAIFFRSEFTEGWEYESPAIEDLVAMLHPGAERLILFHIVASGSCWITTGDQRHWASAGDVIVLPYGDQHRVGGKEPAQSVPITTLFDPPPWDALPVVRYGSGGGRTDLICGYLHSDDPLFDPGLQALPPVFVVRPDEAAARWVESSVNYAMDRAAQVLPDPSDSSRLSQLVLVEVLRSYLKTAPAADRGWIAALRDPVLAPALAAIHSHPERKWMVSELASEAAASRSLLDERFRQLLGRSPIRYLTDWRMHTAQGLLASTELTVSLSHAAWAMTQRRLSAAPSSDCTALLPAPGGGITGRGDQTSDRPRSPHPSATTGSTHSMRSASAQSRSRP